MGCEGCKDTPVPRSVHDADMARMERANKRWFIAFLVVLVLFVASNFAWISYENQFVDEVTEIEAEQETDTGNNYVTGGDLIGTAEG